MPFLKQTGKGLKSFPFEKIAPTLASLYLIIKYKYYQELGGGGGRMLLFNGDYPKSNSKCNLLYHYVQFTWKKKDILSPPPNKSSPVMSQFFIFLSDVPLTPPPTGTWTLIPSTSSG